MMMTNFGRPCPRSGDELTKLIVAGAFDVRDLRVDVEYTSGETLDAINGWGGEVIHEPSSVVIASLIGFSSKTALYDAISETAIGKIHDPQ